MCGSLARPVKPLVRTVLCAMCVALAPARSFAQTNPDGEVTPEAVETARRLFREGVAAAQASHWEEARDDFARTLALRPAPIIRFNLAVACENLNRFVEAIDQYRRFVRETPEGHDPARVSAARQRIEELDRRLAHLRVEVSGDEVRAFRLDGRVQNTALLGVEMPVDPGPHTVDVEGVGGDTQRREGAVYEGESMQVLIALTRAPALTVAGARPAVSRTQSFGHWVARPGPGGRWIDWAARATTPARSRWEEHPLTLSLGLALNGCAGLVVASARYFPQAWFGLEGTVGALGAYGPSGALTAHLRVPLSSVALGAFVGFGLGFSTLTLACSDRGCSDTVNADVRALTLHTGLSVEVALTSHLSLRAMGGVRTLVNPADVRAMGGDTRYRVCLPTDGTVQGSACDAYEDLAGAPVDPLLAVDVGWAF